MTRLKKQDEHCRPSKIFHKFPSSMVNLHTRAKMFSRRLESRKGR